MVASDAELATDAGIGVLEAGGNAIDAAVTTAFALAVVFPEAGNIGGGGFAIVHLASGDDHALDFRETAPAASTRNMFLDKKGNPTDKSVTGALAAGTPGAVMGLWELHQRFGSLPWKDVVQPAIKLARDGFKLSEEFVRMGNGPHVELFAPTKKLFRPNGQKLSVGQLWKNPDLAKTLEAIAKRGSDGFYKGEVARLTAASMKANEGIITEEDLALYRAKWREPVAVPYRGHTIVTMPPPSSGGLVVSFLASFLQHDDLAASGHNTPETIHLLAEGMRHAFARRNHYLGDPEFVEIDKDPFSEQSATKARATVDMKQAADSNEISFPTANDREGRHTTHFSVVDAKGNAVALTTTINVDYGSKLVVEGAGFLLNNEMDDFATAPGKPNAFGLVQGEANAVAPGKRPLSSMTPSVVLDAKRKPVIVTGASGGPTIITATFQVILNVLDFGLDVDKAVSSPRFHHQHLPDAIFHEPGGLDAELEQALRDKGHELKERAYVGNAATLVRTPEGWRGNADPRQHGSVAARTREESATSDNAAIKPAADAPVAERPVADAPR